MDRGCRLNEYHPTGSVDTGWSYPGPQSNLDRSSDLWESSSSSGLEMYDVCLTSMVIFAEQTFRKNK